MAALVLLGCAVVVGVVRMTLRPHHPEAVVSRPGIVAAQDAAAHIGQAITVEGIVSEVHVGDRVTFIDLGGRYPNEEFTGVIFSDDYRTFPDVTKLQRQGRRLIYSPIVANITTASAGGGIR
ncbi:MAG: hypothetical protein HY243_07610 [Proteobacteria bacterium]|nr:hypothetical protein [Pseudomonadota bacterium]